MDFVADRFDKFNEHRNLDPEDPKTLRLFLEHLHSQKGHKKVPLEEAEAFATYSQYCFARKHLKTISEILEVADRKYQRAYKIKKFKSLVSRKSKLFLESKRVLFKTDNVTVIVFAGYVDHETDTIETDFIAVEEFPTKLGKCYRVTSRTFDDPVIFTGHFFDRYAERNGLAINRDDNVIAFLQRMNDMISLAIGQTRTGHCTLPLKTGLALGHKIKEVFIFKTFVHGDDLRHDQIIETMILRNKQKRQWEEEGMMY